MSEDATPKGNREYADEEFLHTVPEEAGEYVSTLTVSRYIGCTFRTANRRLAQLADQEGIEIYDLEENEFLSPEEATGSARPMIGYGKALSDALD